MHLLAIGNAISVFGHEARTLAKDLMDFGATIINNMEVKNVRAIFMDIDFNDRSVLHLITSHEFAQLMTDNKIAALLDELWVGKLSYECDGRNEHFSKLTYLASAPLRQLPG